MFLRGLVATGRQVFLSWLLPTEPVPSLTPVGPVMARLKRQCRCQTELMAAGSTFVFDLFHTLVDTEHLRPRGFQELTAVAEACGVDRDRFGAFWSATYVERETTPLDLLALVERFCETERGPLTADERANIDEIFGLCKDDALRSPEPGIVELLAELARRRAIGVLSNCHEREVRCWAESPLARHVTVFGRSCDIGAMKPDLRPYRWMATQLRAEPGKSVYVGNGSSDELAGARQAGFGFIVHSICGYGSRCRSAR